MWHNWIAEHIEHIYNMNHGLHYLIASHYMEAVLCIYTPDAFHFAGVEHDKRQELQVPT